jgi:raffinose/stachyose/melibiose transport system permease protein
MRALRGLTIRDMNWPLLRRHVTTGVQFLLMLAIALAMSYPIFLMLFTGLKSQAELTRNLFGVPRSWAFSNLVEAWETAKLGNLMKNSLIVSSAVVVGTVCLSLLGGFAFARLAFPAKRLLFTTLTLGLIVPQGTLVIPLFYQMKTLKLLNTYLAVILPQVALGLPFGILLLRGFIQEIPQEIMDAAEVDGCNLWQQFVHIVFPLVRPAAVALAVFKFIWSWNQYLLPLVMIQLPRMRTVPIGLTYFVSRFSGDFTLLSAAASITVVPILVTYIIFHRHIMEARLAGALKG